MGSNLLMTPAYREGMRPLYRHLATALSLLVRLPMSEDLVDLAVSAARGLRVCAFDAGTHSTVAISLLHNCPGALGSMTGILFLRPPKLSDNHAKRLSRFMMRTLLAPPLFQEVAFPSLLDAFFTLPALCAIPFDPAEAARFMAKCTTPVALQCLTHPMAHQRVCVAASLAHFSNLDERFVCHLADNTHLEALLDAAFEAAIAPDDAASTTPSGCSREWHTTALLMAVAHAARACHMALPAATDAAAEEEEPRRKRPRMGLDVSDVGVQHHSSTVFLIAARPFYVHSA